MCSHVMHTQEATGVGQEGELVDRQKSWKCAREAKERKETMYGQGHGKGV